MEAALDVRPVSYQKFSLGCKWHIYKESEIPLKNWLQVLQEAQLGGYNWIEAGLPYGYLRGSYSARADDGQLLINSTSGMPFLDPNEEW